MSEKSPQSLLMGSAVMLDSAAPDAALPAPPAPSGLAQRVSALEAAVEALQASQASAQADTAKALTAFSERAAALEVQFNALSAALETRFSKLDAEVLRDTDHLTACVEIVDALLKAIVDFRFLTRPTDVMAQVQGVADRAKGLYCHRAEGTG